MSEGQDGRPTQPLSQNENRRFWEIAEGNVKSTHIMWQVSARIKHFPMSPDIEGMLRDMWDVTS